MRRPRFTNRRLGLRGPTTLVTVRLYPDMVEAIEGHVGEPDLATRSDVIQDAVALWCVLEEQG